MYYEDNRVFMTEEDKLNLKFGMLNDADYSFIKKRKCDNARAGRRLCGVVVIGNLFFLILNDGFRNIVGTFAWMITGICGFAWIILSLYCAINNKSKDKNTNWRKLVFEVVEVQPEIQGRWNSSSGGYHDYFYPVIIKQKDYQTTMFVSPEAHSLCGKNKEVITYWENCWDGNHKYLSYAKRNI